MDPVAVATRITLRVILIFFLIWLAFTLRIFLLLAFGSWIVVIALDPLVTSLEKRKIPRGLSAILIFTAVLLVFIWLLSVVVPPLAIQGQALIQNLPQVLKNAVNTIYFWGRLNIDERLQPLLEQLAELSSQYLLTIPGDLIRLGQGIVSGIFAMITFYLITLYFLIEYPRISKSFIELFPPEYKNQIEQKITIVNLRLGGWLRGQVVLIFIIGTTTWLGLTILQVPFALPLGIIAGLLEVIPTIGPLFSVIPAAIVAIAISPWKALSVGILYLLIQQAENTIIVPKVMQQTAGLDPLMVILVLTIGGFLMGIPGIFIAIPVTIVVWTILEAPLSKHTTKSKK